MTVGLLLIDVQNDYFEGGKMELMGMENAARHCSRLLEAFRQDDAPIFFLQHLSLRPGSTFFLPDTDGVRINSSVAPLDYEPIVEKHYPNGFRETGLFDKLRAAGVKELVICGAMSHMCVDATTRAAFDFNFRCTVIEDACATRDLVFKGRTIAAADVHGSFMAALGAVYATVMTIDAYVKG